VEAHFRRASEKLAKLCRVLKAGKLNDDAIRTHTLDGRLGNADLVNALTDDFETLLESGIETVVEARLGQGQTHLVVGRGDIDVVDRSAETAGVDLRDQGAQCSFRLGTLIGIGNGDDNGIANCADGLRLDTLGAQLAAGIVQQGPQAVLFQT